MNTKNLLLLISITLLSWSSCRKDSITTEMIRVDVEPEINIESTINGFITDLDGDPIADAQVSILDGYTYTNEFGFFEITGLVNEKLAVLKVEKPGYFDQFETLIPAKNATSQTRIKLIEKGTPQVFASSAGGTFTINGNTTVTFIPTGFLDEQGNLYNGDVSMYSYYIDPTHTDVDQIMPGNLMARNTDNELRVLESYGMIKVILEGESGQKLDVYPSASLFVEIPDELLDSAPEDIPLWYFDEEKGIWREEGSAVLSNGKYSGPVKHFTFWNCDVPNEVTQISGQIFDNKGVATLSVRITDLSTGASFTSWTDDQGGFSGFVPQNVDLLLEILDICGDNVLFSQNIGPFSSEVEDLGIFNVSDNTNFSLVTGTLVDCNQQPISNGIVFFQIPTHSFYQQTTTNSSGEFSSLIPTCDLAEIELSGVDPSTGLVSTTQTLTVNPNIDAGEIEVCVDVDPSLGSVVINVNGFPPKVFDNCYVSIQDGNNNDTLGYSFIYYEDLGNGDTINYYFILEEANNDISNPDWFNSFFFFGPPANATTSLTFTGYTNVKLQSNSVVTVNQVAQDVGEILEISIENVSVTIKEYDANGPDPFTSYPNSSISLIAVVK